MANMIEVQTAFKEGNKARAAQILKTVLHEHPSADAWVMAARLTSNPDTAKTHLQRALAYEPKHVKARDMLRDLGGTPMSTSAALTGGLLPAIRAELEKFGANKPILKNLSPSQRMISALSLYTVIIVMMLVAISTLFAEPASVALPTITYVPVYQSDTLVSEWTAEGLTIDKFEKAAETAGTKSKETLSFIAKDDAGSHPVTVYLYDKVAEIVQDRNYFIALVQDGKSKLEIIQTAVILYPADMNEATVTLLVSVFNASPAEAA